MAKELIKDTFTDDIFDIGMNVMMMVMLFGVMVPMIPAMQAMQRSYAAQAYEGLADSRTLNATGTLRWVNLVDEEPFTPWAIMDIFNDGPDTIYIAVNRPSGFLPVKIGESRRIDMLGANRRIEIIYYKTDAGRSASARVAGKY